MPNPDTYGIYLHIPYCRSKCRYCDFYSAPGTRGVPDEYVTALLRELSKSSRRPDTLYFGGGTPALLRPDQVHRLIKAAAPLPGAEITLEANPDVVTPENLAGFAAAGVTRISFGVQSAHDAQLRRLGRTHTAAAAAQAFAWAREAGFREICGDIMLALPYYSIAEFDKTLALLQAGGCTHISAYLLKIEPGTAFGRNPPPGLAPPRGVLLLGVQGCGKSLLAKAIAGGFGVPLLRLDFGTLYAKYHGETEQNLRAALASADQLAPCVLWIDEIEKGVAADAGDGDGGVSRRVLGYLLTWMAERKAPVFLVATANQVQHLPAELLRKGRFDEIFFVDLPNPDTRVELLRIHLAGRGLDPAAFALPALAAAANGFSGAEIEQAIVSGLYAAHAEQRALDTDLLMAEVRGTRPLSVLMAEQVDALRAWAAERTVPAD